MLKLELKPFLHAFFRDPCVVHVIFDALISIFPLGLSLVMSDKIISHQPITICLPTLLIYKDDSLPYWLNQLAYVSPCFAENFFVSFYTLRLISLGKVNTFITYLDIYWSWSIDTAF